MNQTRITATSPNMAGGPDARATVIVSTPKFLEATPIAIEGLCHLLRLSLLRRNGSPDPQEITYAAEPVGPQLSLVAVAGERV